MKDTLLAILLLTGIPGTPEPTPSEADFPAIREAVHAVAIDLEILDIRETSYIFAKRSDFESDLNLLRRRRCDFADYPRLVDAGRFPPRLLVNELIQFNRAYRQGLIDLVAIEQDRTEMYYSAIMETNRLYRVWDAVRDARCEFYYVTVRRAALNRLREDLGEEDYAAVRLPPNVPIDRFRER
jgi:hypothetical protein